jgi:L-ascorbate metabolism protein UlaG (beta-lactamase superfamily)
MSMKLPARAWVRGIIQYKIKALAETPMRRWAFAILFLLGLAWFGASAGIGNQKPTPLTIEYNGQSFYIITTSKGKRIAFDPHAIPAYYPTGRIELKKADIICISHNHTDHIRTEIFEKTKDQKILRGLKTLSLKSDWAVVDETIGDIKVRTVGVYHDNNEGLQRGKNAVFIIEVDGWRFVHLGDLGHLLTPAQLKRIGPVDVLMIPVGGIYTLNGSEAKKVVEQIKPKEYIFPMHYGTKVFEDILPVDEFLEEQDKRKVAISDDNVITLNRDPQRPRPLIVQLHYWPKEEKKEEKKK